MSEPFVKHEPAPKGHSLNIRYASKLITNALSVPIALISQAIIPRALGPESFGNFSFLANFFSECVTFLDSGTSIGFLGKLSQRPDDRGLVRFYWGFVTAVGLLVGLLVWLSFGIGIHEFLWPAQPWPVVALAAIAAFAGWAAQIASKMIDAHELTVRGEWIRIGQKVLSLFVLALLFWAGWLSLGTLFAQQTLLWVVLISGWGWLLRMSARALLPSGRVSGADTLRYAAEFYRYSAPLLAYAACGSIALLADRWLLQWFHGAAEQGFFGLSYQIGSVCILFTSAMTPLLTREFARAHSTSDTVEIQRLFSRYIPALFSVAAFMSFFLFVHAETVTSLFGGESFTTAKAAVAIMVLYPMHQTYGQLSGSVFYALGQTALYRNIGIVSMVFGLLLTWALMAPRELGGLNLGATGLAYKMVIAQFFAVNIQLWFNTRLLQLSFRRFLRHQLVVMALLGMGAIVSVVPGRILSLGQTSGVVLSACFYMLWTAACIWLLPDLLGATRRELLAVAARIVSMFTRRAHEPNP